MVAVLHSNAAVNELVRKAVAQQHEPRDRDVILKS